MKIKLCIDCRWYDRGVCICPKLMTIDLVTGNAEYRHPWQRSPKIERNEILFWALLFQGCGKIGRFFEPRMAK
jgi:hypothetical protein